MIRSLVKALVYTALFVLTTVSMALAAINDPGGSGVQTVGSVSDLMAAAMQTAGVYAQASILVNFRDALITLAGLCYLCGVVAAVASVAIFGTYKRALYLLLGPALFYYVLDTTQTTGTPVRVGDRALGARSVQDQINFLKKYAPNPNYDQPARVSKIFLLVDNVVSDVVQQIVAKLVDTKSKRDIVVQARDRVWSWMLLSNNDDPAFLRLVSMGAMGECATVTNMAQEIPNHRINTREGIHGAHPDFGDELSNLTPAGRAIYERYIEAKNRPRLNLPRDVLMLVYPTDPTRWDQRLYSCSEVWDLLKEVIIRDANIESNIARFLRGPYDTSVPWAKIREEVLEAIGANSGGDRTIDGGGGNAAQVVAAMILRNMMQKTNHGAMMSQLLEHMPFNARRRAATFEDVARAESYGGWLRIQYFAGAIPYIQGLLLYLLSCAFPFFAVFLVIPSRAETFLVWISLWVWVKSWDIGFAFVCVAREIMWTYMRRSINSQNVRLDWTKPETVFSVIHNSDPFATTNTYYQVIGLLTVSVPFLTAHCCLGATNMFDAFKMSIDQTANRFGQLRTRWTHREIASRREQELFQARHRYAQNWVDHLMAEHDRAHASGDPNARGLLRTPDGRNMSDFGDGTRQEMQAIIFQTAFAQFSWTEEGITRAAHLGAHGTRVVSQSGGNAATLLSAYTRGLNFSFQGQGGPGGRLPGGSFTPGFGPTSSDGNLRGIPSLLPGSSLPAVGPPAGIHTNNARTPE